MQQSNEQDQKKNPGQSSQVEDKQNPQKTNKSGAENSQASGGQMTGRSGKAGQNEDSDVDERTNVEQRGGDMLGNQRQKTGQGTQQDSTGDRGFENSANSGRQQYNLDNDDDIESDNDSQGGGQGMQPNRNRQEGNDSRKGNSPSSDSSNKSSR